MNLTTLRLALPDWTIDIAKNFNQRLLGLMFKSSLPPRHALLLPRCNAIHTCFMRFAIDVVFLDKFGHILEIRPHLRAWRFACVWRAHACLELPAGSAQNLALRVGQSLCTSDFSIDYAHTE